MDVIERGRAEVGKVDTVLKDMADEIERLRAAVAEAACHLSPEGCKAMNAAYASVCLAHGPFDPDENYCPHCTKPPSSVCATNLEKEIENV